MRRTTCLRIAALSACLALASGCRDSTAPGGKHPLVGTWDLSTHLETFAYPTNCLQLCDHTTVAAGPASLTGTLVIGDQVVTVSSDVVRLPLDSATIHEVMCSGTPPCSQALAERVVLYAGSGLTLENDSLTGTPMLAANGGGEYIYLFSGRFLGDSLVGRLQWNTFSGVASQYYIGSFVARRHR